MIDEDILSDVTKSEWIKAVKNVFSSKSRNEFVSSEYTKELQKRIKTPPSVVLPKQSTQNGSAFINNISPQSQDVNTQLKKTIHNIQSIQTLKRHVSIGQII
ncbi:MAG: hypothetical protein RR263_04330 [Oscillospiraceae bacterium]